MHLVRRRRRRPFDGETIAGQNADLPSFYSRLLVLMHRTIPGQGRMTTLTPAGQIGYHGMNEHGGCLRQLPSHRRLARRRAALPPDPDRLAERTREAALAAVTRTQRASRAIC